MPQEDNFKTERDAASLWINGLMIGTNLSAVILHGLVARGVFTAEVARELITDAEAKIGGMELPSVYKTGAQKLMQKYRESLRE